MSSGSETFMESAGKSD